MRLTLEIATGSLSPRSITIEPTAEVRAGCTSPAQLVLDDQTMSPEHFALGFDGRDWRIRDLGSSHGTALNGTPVKEAVLSDRDLILAGLTTLRVKLANSPDDRPSRWGLSNPEAAQPDSGAHTTPSAALLAARTARVVETLVAQEGSLYAILDAARDPLILVRLREGDLEHQSLYEGAEGEKLKAFAPYLVSLARDSSLLETIVRDGWGKSWGVYLVTDHPFADIRKHLRHFLIVQLEAGKQAYFRFYDPRVLRAYLPSCSPEEAATFLGPIRHFIFETESIAELQIVTILDGRLHTTTKRLASAPNPKAATI
jgi:hypothetical protein